MENPISPLRFKKSNYVIQLFSNKEDASLAYLALFFSMSQFNQALLYVFEGFWFDKVGEILAANSVNSLRDFKVVCFVEVHGWINGSILVDVRIPD